MRREHRGLVAVLAAGFALRVLVMIAYRPAFWFPDSSSYLEHARLHVPNYGNQFGYSAFLMVFHWHGISLALVAAIQHLLAVGLAVLCYAFLIRRGCPRWLSLVAILPLVFDGRQLTIEHYILTDLLFTVLLTTGVLLVFWGSRSPWIYCLAGGLLAAACVTRIVGLPVAAAVTLYVLVRRVGLRQSAAFALALAFPLASYVLWFHHYSGVYGFSAYQGGWMYGRVSTFADCGRLDLRPELRELCPAEPVDARQPVDYYVWGPGRPRAYGKDDKLVREFAYAAIAQQPGDYLHDVSSDLWHFVDPFWQPDPVAACDAKRYEMPADPRAEAGCDTLLANSNGDDYVADPRVKESALTHALNWYSAHVRVPGFLIVLLLVVVAARAARDRRRWTGWEPLIMYGFALIIPVVATATVRHEPRYLVPSIPLIFVAAALATATYPRARAFTS